MGKKQMKKTAMDFSNEIQNTMTPKSKGASEERNIGSYERHKQKAAWGGAINMEEVWQQQQQSKALKKLR
jgi:hypothetical protein